MHKSIKILIYILIALTVSVGGYFGVSHILHAEENNDLIYIYNSDLNEMKKIDLWGLEGGYDLSIIDLGGDGKSEILIGAGKQSKSLLKILRGDGSLINEFLVYNEKFTDGINIAGCDFNGDGKGEILVGANKGGGAHVRIFDGYGKTKINNGFFAFDEKIKNGVQIGCADIDGDNIDEILAVGGEEIKQLKIFNIKAELIKQIDLPFVSDNIDISSVDLGGDGVEEILISGGFLDKPLVQIYRGDLSLINEFYAYAEKFSGGVEVFGIDIDNDGKQEIVTVPGLGGGPHLRVFDGYGKEKKAKFVFRDEFIGGLSLGVGDIDGDNFKEFLVAPKNLPVGNKEIYKYIDIDVSDQTFKCYQNGFLVCDLITSTGKPSTPTRYGEFTAFSKYPMAYGGADGMRWGMPWFIGFYTAGGLENGIHELPFLNGAREGTGSLGRAVSHGCVRLQIGDAKIVYDWVEIDKTKVIVHL
ncbi:MAG: L,D-transpeptidase family protein [Patescibacteria group bacterium]